VGAAQELGGCGKVNEAQRCVDWLRPAHHSGWIGMNTVSTEEERATSFKQ